MTRNHHDNFRVRVLTPADARSVSLRAPRNGSNEEPPAFGSRPQDEPNLAETAERLAASDDRCFFGAFHDRQLVGIVRLSRDYAPHTRITKLPIWEGLYVLPAFRRRSLGTYASIGLLTLDRAANLPGIRRINLSVVTGQAAAIHLYQSFGFRAYGTERETFSRDGRFYDEHLMALEIGSPAGIKPPVTLTS